MKNILKIFILALGIPALGLTVQNSYAAPEQGAAWSLEDLNTTVDQTNFIVDNRCSGTLVDLEHKLVLTNYHCIRHKVREVTDEEVVDGKITKVRKEKVLDVPISQKAYEGYEEVGRTSYVTRIVAKSQEQDLALLQIKADTIPFSVQSRILPETEDVVRGETAYAVGNPRMLDASVTKGILSSVNRMIAVPWAKGQEIAFVQYDGGMVGGNSGGALYNNRGYLIGVPAAGAESTVGLAISIGTVRDFLRANCWAIWQGATLGDECAAE